MEYDLQSVEWNHETPCRHGKTERYVTNPVYLDRYTFLTNTFSAIRPLKVLVLDPPLEEEQSVSFC
jgi:hypothetical protein